MAYLTRTITRTSTGAGIKAKVNTLHSELLLHGLPVAAEELDAGSFGEGTQTSVGEFQDRYLLPKTGELDPATAGIMTLSALVMESDDKRALAQSLRAAEKKVSNSPAYKYWLARSALIAGDYEFAHEVHPTRRELIDAGVLVSHLHDLVLDSDDGPAPPDVDFPENFYTYRYNLMAQEDIDALRTGASVQSGRTTMMKRRLGDDPEPEEPPDGDPPPPPTPPNTRPAALAASAQAFLSAVEAWQYGNQQFLRRRYAAAVSAYDNCQEAVLNYFRTFPDYKIVAPAGPQSDRVDHLLASIVAEPRWSDVMGSVNHRRQLLALGELTRSDWQTIHPGHITYQILQANLNGLDQPIDLPPLSSTHRFRLIDWRLVIWAAVLLPLARAEANSLRRQYSAAAQDLSRVLRREISVPNVSPPRLLPFRFGCEFIEIPFARLKLAESLLDRGEAQFKAKASINDEPETEQPALRQQIDALAAQLTQRGIPGDPSNATSPFQLLTAALAFAQVREAFADDGLYTTRVDEAVDLLARNVQDGDPADKEFAELGNQVTIPTVESPGQTIPGLSESAHPHESYVHFASVPMRERNPRVYALMLSAQGRLLQIWSGFNYLGYRDDYVPPWRFQYLLERSRYLAEHTRNAQRDYLNFLSNAENEESKESSAAQNVELEKANVQIETARVDQATKEVAASKQSERLAEIQASDAAQRVTNYRDFSEQMDDLDTLSFAASVLGAVANPGLGSLTGLVGGYSQMEQAQAQRELELKNLQLAVGEARQARQVAAAQGQVARAGLVVAGLQRQASLLRHSFALQNLAFMRDRMLNSEQWYRLTWAIRSVSDTYLRYSIEMAFLAQRAYQFESDRRLDVIRFDYDLSDVGAMLAGDFLLQDLDTLEQEVIVSEKTRQQQVRYVLSLSKEQPEALRELSETGEVTFSVRLEQLERQFPGLYNMRILKAELTPVALMDPARLSVNLTHTGFGLIRRKLDAGIALSGGVDPVSGDDWLTSLGDEWGITVRTSPPESVVLSGLSRDELVGLNVQIVNQRAAFEGLPAASGWQLRMSMTQNHVVPGTLADVLITFVMTGLFDDTLEKAVRESTSTRVAATTFLSARRTYPDAFYNLVNHGRLDWTVSKQILGLTGSPSNLRNLAVAIAPSQQRPELGRYICSYPIEIDAQASGVDVRSALPEVGFTFAPNELSVSANYSGGEMLVDWDFGDGTTVPGEATAAHTYRRPGIYEASVRIAKNGRLSEYRYSLVISREHSVTPPLVLIPEISGEVKPDGRIELRISIPSGGPDVSIDCSVGTIRASAVSTARLLVEPGRHALNFSAIRRLSARIYGNQRFVPDPIIVLDRGRIATNRTYDPSTSAETTSAATEFSQHVFGNPAGPISPLDRWTLELPLQENPWFLGVSSADVSTFEGRELGDASLVLEYLVDGG